MLVIPVDGVLGFGEILDHETQALGIRALAFDESGRHDVQPAVPEGRVRMHVEHACVPMREQDWLSCKVPRQQKFASAQHCVPAGWCSCRKHAPGRSSLATRPIKHQRRQRQEDRGTRLVHRHAGNGKSRHRHGSRGSSGPQEDGRVDIRPGGVAVPTRLPRSPPDRAVGVESQHDSVLLCIEFTGARGNPRKYGASDRFLMERPEIRDGGARQFVEDPLLIRRQPMAKCLLGQGRQVGMALQCLVCSCRLRKGLLSEPVNGRGSARQELPVRGLDSVGRIDTDSRKGLVGLRGRPRETPLLHRAVV